MSIKDLRKSVFSSSEVHSTQAAPQIKDANPLVIKTKVYTLGSDKAGDVDTVRAFHLFMMAAGASMTEERALWNNWVATLCVLCMPKVRSDVFTNPEYEEHVLNDTQVTELMNWYDLYCLALEPTEPADVREASLGEAKAVLPLSLDLPLPVLASSGDVKACLEAEAVYGHFSIVLFLAGKTINEKNQGAVSQKRPQAIERKYYNGKTVLSLSGGLKMSRMAHTYVHRSFVVLGHLRRCVFLQVALFTPVPTSTVEEIIATTTRLMAFAGMQQAVIIDNFLAGHEEALDVPFLMGPIQKFISSMETIQSAPAEQRAYYKVIHGDTTRVFNRNDILPLLAVALVSARELNPTLMNYEIPANYQLIMLKYHEAIAALAAQDD